MTGSERTIIRDLAKRVAELAARPEQEEKRRLWYAQNALRAPRPLVFCSPEGAWVELIPENSLACENAPAREIERDLRMRIYAQEHFADDQVCDRVYRVRYAAETPSWGLGPEYHYSETERGSYVWDPPIKTRVDIDRLQTPTASVNGEATQRNLQFHQELLGDILEVQLHGDWWWSLGLVDEWARLRGITQMFLDMSDDPELMHAGMQRLLEGKLAWLESLERQGLLGLNNGNGYVGSGGFGFTEELPRAGFDDTARLADLWGFCEAQTFSEVGPAMHEEFGLRYQLPILERFGLNCYGCCEPLHLKLDLLLRQVPRLRRVSISSWADKRLSAEKLEKRAIYSWKPNPAYVAAVDFDPELVRRDLRETIGICREHGCALEIILKDTHTCNHQPWRLDVWTRIAAEEATRR